MKRLGIDIGSLYLGSVILEDGEIVDSHYIDHRGDIEGALEALFNKQEYRFYDSIGVTGNLRSSGNRIIDNTLSTIEGSKYLLPGCRNIFSIGGESFSLILFDRNGKYSEHSINSPCAAGTGSFIEQQAERLNLTAAELASSAFSYTGKTPVIATRCAVFAKTDIIHAMQEGYSLDGICAGLCQGIARNILDVLVKGREIFAPVGVVGGLSLNPKIVGEIQDILAKPVTVPRNSQVTGAVGAALLGDDSGFDFHSIINRNKSSRNTRIPLEMKLTSYPDFSEFKIYNDEDVEVFLPKEGASNISGVYIGVDIGSTSTKALVMNSKKEILGGFYTNTQGQPISAVQKLIETINSTFKEEDLFILGVGTTGSGRKMIKELFSADLEINEITAHAKASIFLNPEVDTIIEIGGQDSKFTRLRGREVYYSIMNYICAAGTGSFIEEQAKRLGVSLKNFSDLAFGARAPYTSDRCTVYMERDLTILLSEGWSKEALAHAVLNSVRDNYIAKVVNRSPFGNYIAFQGATARNKALVASFEQLLKRPIHVSPYCHLTGALGVALLLKESGINYSRFIWDTQNVKVEKENCNLCANKCVLTIIKKNGKKTGWGMKCGREYEAKSVKKSVKSGPEKRFKEVMKPLFKTSMPELSRDKTLIGLPPLLYNTGYLPLWYSLFKRLGFKVSVKRPSRKALAEGKKIVNSDFCAPMVISHGYVKQLLDKDVDYIFCPAIVNEKDREYRGEFLFKKKTNDAYFCYYSQYLPTIVSRLTAIDIEKRLISPLINFNQKSIEDIVFDIYEEMNAKITNLTFDEVRVAFDAAYREYTQARKNWEKTYSKLNIHADRKGNVKIVLMGRPYVMFDPALNLNIPRRLEQLGADIFWQDEFEIDEYKPTYGNKYYERMHWHYGKRIIKLSELCASSNDLFVIYLTCFRCSPDSFLISYVKDIMTYYEKPFLILQLDEHTSDVGYTTRIEAGMRSFENFMKKKRKAKPSSVLTAQDQNLEKKDTVLIPCIDQLIGQFWAACFRHAGYRAFLLYPDEKALNTGYQYASGGECMPLISLMGGVVEKVRNEKLNPKRTYFYMPTVCMACNFPQFPILSDLVFHSAGLEGLKIGLVNNLSPGKIISNALSIKILESYIAGCIIYKMYNRIKPYEIEIGKTDRVFSMVKKNICEAILIGMDFRSALNDASEMFRGIRKDESDGRKPRIGLLGDLYVKYNELVNMKVQSLVQELGGELIVPSMTDFPFHFFDADIRLHGDDPRHYKLLKSIEHRYEKMALDIIGDQLEPDFAECVALMNEYKIKHYIVGETSISVGRALYYIKNSIVDAIIHINPIFCCPGVVTSSIFRKIQEDFNIPIIDIFYDGTGNPNRVLIPHLHYLRKKSK